MKRSILLNSTLALATAGIGFAGYKAMGTTSVSKVTTSVFEAKKGIVLTAVTASGNVQVPGQVDAAFDSSVTSNKVTEIMVKVGDKVTIGQPLARVSDVAGQTALASAEASYASTKASTDKVKAGLTSDDKTQIQSSNTQSKISLNSAQAALDNAQTNADFNARSYTESVRQSTLSLDAAKAQADRDSTTSQLSVDQSQATADREAVVYSAAKSLAESDEANRLPCDSGGTPVNGGTCAQATNTANLSKAALAKEETTQTQAVNGLTNARNSLESAKLKSAQSITSATNSLTNAQNNQTSSSAKDDQAIDNAGRQLETAQASYSSTLAANNIKLKSPTEADLAQANVSMVNAETALATAKKNVENTTLLAPAAGTIATINGKIGASPGGSSSSSSGASSGSSTSSTSAFLVITDLSVLEVKAGFSEADAAKVKVDQGVTVTLDALAGKLLSGKVRAIDTVSTLVSNVVTYYVYVTVDGSDAAVKPGMTSSLSVVVEKAENVVTLPSSAVTARGSAASVKVQTGATTNDVEVRNITLGLKGDTLVEVKSGLLAGDKVIVTRGGATTTGGSGTLTGATPVGGAPGGNIPGGAPGGARGGAGG